MIDGILQFQKDYQKDAEKLLLDHQDIFAKPDIDNFQKDLSDSLHSSSRKTLMLLAQKQLIGIICYGKDEYSHNAYFIFWLVVKKEFEGKGNGSLLVEDTCKRIREEGGRHVYLETSNAHHNEHSKDFYHHLGFKQVGLLPDFFDHPLKKYSKLEDAALFHKAL